MQNHSITICPGCGTPFTPKNRPNPTKFCTPPCYYEYRRSVPLTERFWPRVLKADGCWLWQGPVNRSGYGWLKFRHASEGARYLSAHCVSWILHNGPIPKGMEVCHSCDVNYPTGDISYRICVRPEHLFLGTRKDNAEDAARKGRMAFGDRNGARLHPERMPRGEACGAAKLMEDQVQAIRKRYATGDISQQRLALEYEVEQPTISVLVRRKTWCHI